MSKLLQINHRLNSPVSSFLGKAQPIAELLATVPGLRWKIWLKNEDESEGGGLYLFEDGEALSNFVEGPILEKLKINPMVEEVTVKKFEVPADLSSITRAPI